MTTAPHPKKDAVTPQAGANSSEVGTASNVSGDVEAARPSARHKSAEAMDRSTAHDVESNADASQSGNLETGTTAARESIESLPVASGDAERI